MLFRSISIHDFSDEELKEHLEKVDSIIETNFKTDLPQKSHSSDKVTNLGFDIVTTYFDFGYENWQEVKSNCKSTKAKHVAICWVDDYVKYWNRFEDDISSVSTVVNSVEELWKDIESICGRKIKKEKKISHCRVCKEINEYMDSDDIEDDGCFTCWNCANDYNRALIGLTGNVKNKIMMIRKYNNIRRNS